MLAIKKFGDINHLSSEEQKKVQNGAEDAKNTKEALSIEFSDRKKSYGESVR